MPLTYASGEAIQAGDRICYAGEAGEVEFVAEPGDPETGWYVERFGRGCMIALPSFGHVFLSETEDEEDLDFVSRGTPKPARW